MRGFPGFWVACRSPQALSDPLAVSVPGLGEALALFCFEEEAELYLGYVSDCLRPCPVGPDELVVLLLGSWSRFELVTLDPMPGNDAGIMLRLATMRRDEFLSHFLHKRGLARRSLTESPALS
jgi:hypothetical protein